MDIKQTIIRGYQHNSSPKVAVYLRKTNRTGMKVLLPSSIKVSMLLLIVQTQIKIPIHNIVLFHEGKTYPGTEINDLVLRMKNNDIVHVHDLTKMKKGMINLLVQVIMSDNSKGQTKLYSINSQTHISSFLQRILSNSFSNQELFMLESGRKLNPQLTIHQQYIEDESTIFLVVKDSSIQPLIQLKNYLQIPSKKLSELSIDLNMEEPSFKKKNTSQGMIPTYSVDAQLCENDGNNELVTSLRRKKSSEPEKRKLTDSGKSRLKEEFSKLFQFQMQEEKLLDDVDEVNQIIFEETVEDEGSQ